jgi:RNA polymerase sigma-70 factor (ECF subfamily)
MPSESDRLLVQGIRNGDAGAWEQLIARYEGRLQAFARQRLHDKDNADDVVQETFVGFITSLPNYDDRRELQTYLFTICAHKITDVLRRSSRRPQRTGSEGMEDVLNNQLDSHQHTASSAARSLEQRELEGNAIARGLTQIIRRWQADAEYDRLKVLELLLVRGWPNRDVAKFLRITEQQVANIRFAAMKKLADHVRDAGLPADIFPELQEAERK